MKILMHSLVATGHLNATIGVAQALADRGHDVVYLIHPSAQTRLEKLGFRVIPLTPTEENKFQSSTPVKDLARIMHESGFFSNQTSLEKIKTLGDPSDKGSVHTVYQTMVSYNPHIEAALQQEAPDLVMFDQMLYFPAWATYPCPWMSVMSTQPKSIYPRHPDLSPPMSGLDVNQRDEWEEFQNVLDNTLAYSSVLYQNKLNERYNFSPSGQYSHALFYMVSPYLNIYQYPKELDYKEQFPDVKNFFGVDAFVRQEPERLELPENFAPKDGGKLIFLSMGSMGGFDVELMKRLVRLLAELPYKVIVSKGPLGEQYELADNMWGANTVPQTSVLPLVDLVITHGGNNTVCESLSYGKPMIVMPLFGDQYDNAQRIPEKGFGRRINPYDFDNEDFVRAVHELINDEQLKARLEQVREDIRERNTKEKLCIEIEKIVKDFKEKHKP